jgi:hypothetical protein
LDSHELANIEWRAASQYQIFHISGVWGVLSHAVILVLPIKMEVNNIIFGSGSAYLCRRLFPILHHKRRVCMALCKPRIFTYTIVLSASVLGHRPETRI